MPRSSMTDLIDRVQLLIDDVAAVTWTEDQVEDALDQTRVHHHNELLTSQPKLLPGNVITYRDHFSQFTYWEKDAGLRAADGSTLSPDPATSDYMIGYWFFGASQAPPIYIDGKTYDPYAAAVLLLEEWAAKRKGDFDFQDGAAKVGQKDAPLSQRFKQYLELIRLYKGKTKPRKVRMVRGDENAWVR